MLSLLPGDYSFIIGVAKPKPDNPQGVGFCRRVLQVRLCFVRFIGGLTKFLGNCS
jgi:hypothetical protein